MKRALPLPLIVFGALGAFLIAMVGVSAHSGGIQLFNNIAGITQTHQSDEASGARTEASESPEGSPTSKPSEKAEPTPIAKPTPDSEPDEDDMPKASPTPTPKAQCEDECGGGGGGD